MEANTYHFSLDEVDDATAALIVQLQREDVEELQSSDKGKNRESDFSDADLAMTIFQEELQHSSVILNDRCMSRSLAQAVITDSALLTDIVAHEDAIANDRLVAERLDSGEEIGSGTEAILGDPDQDDLLIARLTALYVSGTEGDCNTPTASEDEQSARGESSRWAASRENTSNTARHECASCGDYRRAFETFRAPCRHYYCQECLTQLFELSTTDETLFPPRCCRQEIPSTSVRLYLSGELVQRFQKKVIEFQTSDRTYCSRPTCSAFITPDNITGELATCTSCFTNTCTICKGTNHDGDCPADTATQQMLEAAREQGWQRCYNCRRVVELDVGCNHMTYAFCIPLLYTKKTNVCPSCPCGAQFCYVCGERWKTCPCDQWNEARLLARAQQVVAREQPRNPAPAAEQLVQVQQAVENLRDRHNCTHESWRWVRGPNQCEECYHNLPRYIFECRQCRIRACNRCKRNRL